MKVLLVVPPRLLWPFMNEQDNFLLPQSIPCLAGVLREAGVAVEVLDCLPLKMGWRSLETQIRTRRPDVVAAGENHAMYASEVTRLMALAKELCPDTVTIAGGAHFTNLADQYLRSDPIDFVVRGEGEISFLRLVQALESGGVRRAREVRGVTYLDDDQVHHNPPRPLVENLDDLPLPAYDLMPMDQYGRARYLFSPGGTTMHHSRGCSSQCHFCVWWTQMADRRPGCTGDELSPRWRTKSVERTLEEMEILYRRYDKRCLVFVDPSFNLDARWNDEFATALIRKQWDLRWFAFMRADCILRDERNGIFEKLVRSGLTHVSIGVERAEDAHLHAWRKRFYSEGDTTRTFDLLRRKYPQIFRQATFIIGVRNETPESIRRQLEFARHLHVDFPAFHSLTPFPGTALWREAQEKGWLELTDFDYYDMSTPVMASDTMSREAIEAALIRLNQDYTTIPWLARGLLSPHSYRRDMYIWFLNVLARVFADSVAHRLNPFQVERYTALVKPRWYDR